MYGMINQAILEYFRDQHGAETADEVRAHALCEQTQFGSMTQYPDEISYALIGAAAEILGQPADDLMGKALLVADPLEKLVAQPRRRR